MSLEIETQSEMWNLTAGNVHESNILLPGETIDYSDRGPWIIAIAATLTALSFIFVFLRLFTRCRVLNSTGKDDHCILLALILSVGNATCIILSVVKGDNGKHTWMIKDVEAMAAYNSKVAYAGSILQYICMGFLRASIVCFLLRLSPGRKLRVALRILLCAVISLAVTATFVTAFRCSNPARQWATNAHASEKKCLDPMITGYIIPGIGLLLNILIYTLPLPLMWKLDLPMRQRIGLIALFQLGALGIVGCILQLSYSAVFLRSADPFWDTGPVLIWLLIEIHMMMIGSSLPILKALWLHIFNPSPKQQDITELETNERPFAYNKDGSTGANSNPNLPTFSFPRPCPFSGRRGSKATQNGGTGLEDPPHLHEKQPQTLKDGRHISSIQTFDPDFFLPTPPSTPLPPADRDEEQRKKSHLTTVLEHTTNVDLDREIKSPTPFSFSATAPLNDFDGKRKSIIITTETELDEDRVKTAETSFSYGGTEPLPPAYGTEPLGSSDEDIRYEPTVPSPAHFQSLNGGFLSRNSTGFGLGRNGWGWGSRRADGQEGRDNE
ncbi:hypothetical protein BJ508DRAFT_378162 [Ascobolus immersus RN42]|uniref:Rhodopsin domain-containing protein n=1 Tax=Ascobolus immersus RN42 TaxID=1160509 RepID=A0A3N4HXV7_ASCIM|nr:hypothetical protein BJ508DRAFT_378162 [Ascobolus immersus RN42]